MGRYDLTLYNYFKQKGLGVVYLTSSGDETFIRCPFCGDSKKDSRKARFYIHNEAPFKYYCFNCDTTGVINEEVLNLIFNDNFYDQELSSYLREKKMESLVKANKITRKVRKNPYFNPNYKVDFSCKSKKSLNKLDYLNERLGIKLTKKDLEKFKIVVSIKTFFEKNNLDLEKRIGNSKKTREIVESIEKNYIGFLSSDRNIIIFRNLDKDSKLRFNNFKIFPDDNIDSSKVYNISTVLNKFEDKHEVVIAEGPIDIIGAYFNVFNEEERDKKIFLANGGKSYINSTNMLANLSLLNNHYTIMSDKDVGIDFYKRIKSITPALYHSNISIYYNLKEKDFGVKKEDIELSGEFEI